MAAHDHLRAGARVGHDLPIDRREDLPVELRIVLVPSGVLAQTPKLLDGARARVLGDELRSDKKVVVVEVSGRSK